MTLSFLAASGTVAGSRCGHYLRERHAQESCHRQSPDRPPCQARWAPGAKAAGADLHVRFGDRRPSRSGDRSPSREQFQNSATIAQYHRQSSYKSLAAERTVAPQKYIIKSGCLTAIKEQDRTVD